MELLINAYDIDENPITIEVFPDLPEDDDSDDFLSRLDSAPTEPTCVPDIVGTPFSTL